MRNYHIVSWWSFKTQCNSCDNQTNAKTQGNNYHMTERTHLPGHLSFLNQTQTWVNSSRVMKPSRFLSKSLKAVSAFEALSDLLITSTLTKLSNISRDRVLKSLLRVWRWTLRSKLSNSSLQISKQSFLKAKKDLSNHCWAIKFPLLFSLRQFPLGSYCLGAVLSRGTFHWHHINEMAEAKNTLVFGRRC